MRPGPHNAITDVPGIRVGQVTRDEPGWLTGCTVVIPPPGTVGGVDVRGGGPGTRETDLLDPVNLVDAVDAIVLSGGSAFGLGVADGAMREVYAAGLGWPALPGDAAARVPIVPAAILFDLGRGGTWLHHPGPEDGAAAYRGASDGPVAQGCVGAGTGALAGGLKGGIGSASCILESGITVGAIVAVNAIGSPVDPRTGDLLGRGRGLPGELDGAPRPGAMAPPDPSNGRGQSPPAAGTATTIGVIATDAALTKAQCHKLAQVSHDGLARAIAPVHTAYDGDTLFTLATGTREPADPVASVALQSAAADCVSRAIVHAMLAATSVDRSADGGLVAASWRDSVLG